MSPRLSREASAWLDEVLDEVRRAEEPTDGDEARVKRALDASVAAGVTCHWERYPLRRDAERGDAERGDAAAPPAAELGNAAATVAKAGAVVWAAPLSVVGLCAAAWFSTALFEQGDGEPVAPHSAISAPAQAPTADTAPTAGTAAPTPDTAAPTPDTAMPTADTARSKAAARPSPAAPARRRESAQRPESSGLGAELALLQRSQAALRRGDAAAALRELDAFPDGGGQLLAERRVARVLALCSLNRAAEAQALAAEVVRSDPGSVQRAALERSCANPSRNRGR